MAGDSAGGREVGRISIRVVPDLKNFRTKLQAELEEIEKSVKGNIEVEVDLLSAQARVDMALLMARLKEQAADGVTVETRVDTDPIKNAFSGLGQGGLGGIGHGLAIVAAVAAFAAPALALISGLLVSLPAVIAGVLTPIAAIALGLDGIKKAAEVLKPGFDALKATMSQKFQDVLTPVFTKLNDVFPALQESLPRVAEALGAVAGSFVDVLTSQSGLANLKGIINNIADTITASAPGIGKLTDGLLGLANGVSSKFPAIGKYIDSVGDSFQKWVAKASQVDASGTSPLDRAMGNLGDTLKGVLDIIGDLAKQGFDFLQDPKFGKSMKDFVEDAKILANDVLPPLKQFFIDLTGAITTATDAIHAIKTLNLNTGQAEVGQGIKDDLTKPFTSADAPWRAYFAKLKTAWTEVTSFVSTTWGQLIGDLSMRWSAISTAGSQVWATISAAASAAWAGVTGIVSGAVNSVVGFFARIPAAASSIWSGLTGVASAVWAGVVAIFVNAMTQLVVTVTTQGAQVISWFEALPGKITSAIGSIDLSGIGMTIIEGLGRGIRAGVDKLLSYVSTIAKQIADHKGPISYDKTVLTPNGQALMQGLKDGIDGGLQGVLDRASSIAGQLSDAINGGGTVQVDGLKDQLKRAMDELTLEGKQLKVDFDAIPKTDKDARKTNQDQRAAVQTLKDQLSLQSEQLGFSQKYGDNVKDADANWGEISKKLGNVGLDFAKATGGQFMSDIGMSGHGAITGGLQAGLDWVTQLGTTNIHVNSLDEGLAAKQNLTNKRALQYTQR